MSDLTPEECTLIMSILPSIMDRITAIESNLGVSPPSSLSSNVIEIPRSIKAFDSYFATCIIPFIETTVRLGSDVEKAGQIIQSTFLEMRKFLLLASKCKEPSDVAIVRDLLSNLFSKATDLSKLISRNEWEKHMKTLSEGLGLITWLQVKPAPVDYIENFIGASDYHANNIRKEHKNNPEPNTDADHIDFCNSFKKMIQELMVYVKEYHLTGVTWNTKGINVTDYSETITSESTSKISKDSTIQVKEEVVVAPKLSAPKVDLLAGLKKGADVTSGLKTVTKDMQTWRSEYKGSDAPAPVVVKASVVPRIIKAKTNGPAKLFFNQSGCKWEVENQTDENGVINVDIKENKETVYIYGCYGATIDIKGKCKSIVLDQCQRTNCFFDNVMASCEIVNSTRIKIQSRGVCPSIAIDKTDGIVVFLSKDSLDSEIICSKSSEMNVSFEDKDGEWIERPIPEQYVHRIKEGNITANVSDLYGSSSSAPTEPQSIAPITVVEVKKVEHAIEEVVSALVQSKEILKCSNSSCKCPDCTCGAACTCGISPEVSCDPCNDFKAAMMAKKAAAETKATKDKVDVDKSNSTCKEKNIEPKPVVESIVEAKPTPVVETVIKSAVESSVVVPVIEKAVPATPEKKQGMFSKFTSLFSPSAKDPAPVSKKTYPPITRTYTIEELTKGTLDPDVDPTKKEDYLDDLTFNSIFGMKREEYNKLAKWRQESKKKACQLF